jgi:hypothetical protein
VPGNRRGDSPGAIPKETIVRPDDYLRSSDELLDQAKGLRPPGGSERAAGHRAEAQVKAIQAVAAAIDRLAAAVEALPGSPGHGG